MPGIITHYLCGIRVLDLLNDNNIEKNTFLWGCQGPDLFFFHRFFPWSKGQKLIEYGTRLHDEKPSVFFEVMRKYQNTNPPLSDLTLSYELGMVCHYVLDRSGHPFVYSGTKELEKNGSFPPHFNFHSEIESNLDIIMLRYERSATPVEFDLRNAVPKGADTEATIISFYKYILRHRFGIEPDNKSLSLLCRDTIKMFGHLNNRSMIKKPMVQFWEKIFGKKGSLSVHLRGITEGDDYDFANIQHLEWSGPAEPDKIRTDSFIDIFEAACAESADMIQKYRDMLTSDVPMSQLTEDISFLSGIKIV